MDPTNRLQLMARAVADNLAEDKGNEYLQELQRLVGDVQQTLQGIHSEGGMSGSGGKSSPKNKEEL